MPSAFYGTRSVPATLESNNGHGVCRIVFDARGGRIFAGRFLPLEKPEHDDDSTNDPLGVGPVAAGGLRAEAHPTVRLTSRGPENEAQPRYPTLRKTPTRLARVCSSTQKDKVRKSIGGGCGAAPEIRLFTGAL